MAGAPVDVKLFGKWSFEDIEVILPGEFINQF
jgi:hypothetical protein